MDKNRKYPLQLPVFVFSLAGAAFLSVVDLTIKWAVETIIMDPPHRIPLLPFFDLVLVFNLGVSFGLLDDLGRWGPIVLSGLAIGIVGVLIIWLWRAQRMNEIIGITLIIGGAIGNLIDRLYDDAVTDFLNLYVGQYHWPVFNSADVFITIGALCLLLPDLGKRTDVARKNSS